MATIGPLAGENPEPMTQDAVGRIAARVQREWSQMVCLDVAEARNLLELIEWQRERLQRIEAAILPLVESLRGE